MKNGMKNLWNHFKDNVCFHDFQMFLRLEIDGIAIFQPIQPKRFSFSYINTRLISSLWVILDTVSILVL